MPLKATVKVAVLPEQIEVVPLIVPTTGQLQSIVPVMIFVLLVQLV